MSIHLSAAERGVSKIRRKHVMVSGRRWQDGADDGFLQVVSARAAA